ncbi:putative phage baseplate assembly protein [Streptomyces sp. TLI_235]|nr:putative baseplate assembly protein [Streptomyces sp. TLI_235]PBC75954.1 putative phage baseplate assembly protein [Streptomyces sp. TLI_235]
MTLPAPNLDDRRFQDIVDEAKRRIAAHCPEWTDHNVSDPGVALIELFAWMTEMIVYRLNQVPDRLYVKFLELVGITLRSAQPAVTDLLFDLTGPAKGTVLVRRGTRVGTERDETGDQVVFMTKHDLRIVQPELTACLTRSGGRYQNRTDDVASGAVATKFFGNVSPGDALYLGFRDSLAANLLRLDLTVGTAGGAGADVRYPPLAWQSWDGTGWQDAPVHQDTTGSLNRSGRVTVLLASRHEPLTVDGVSAHWVRCELRAVEGVPSYESSPTLYAVAAATVGGTATAEHAEAAPEEFLGTSTGRPGQSFTVRRAPVLVRGAGEAVEVRTDGESQLWGEVEEFSGVGPDDRYVTWHGATGEIRFGPRITGRDGTARQYGAVPPENARILVTGYRYGGGSRGNVGTGKLNVLLTSVPQVGAVRNLAPATGGVDAETLQNARLRGPIELRSGQRAVTAADFERLTLEGVPAVARAHCPTPQPDDPVRLLLVPRIADSTRYLTPEELEPDRAVTDAVKRHLDPRRLLTTQVLIGKPSYQGVAVTAAVRAAATADPDQVRSAAEAELYRFVNPVSGGPGGRGWPFGLGLSNGFLYAVLGAVPGVLSVISVQVSRIGVNGELLRVEPGRELKLRADELFVSGRHTVGVTQ